jgi:arylformamidase
MVSADNDFLEREYNPRATIPNALALFSQWKVRAAEARAANKPRIDLVYGDAPSEKLDFFAAADAGGSGSPVLVFIHGGYWRALDKADFSWIAPAYVAAGISVAVVNYGLAPKTPMPEIVEQIRRAIAWIYANADELGVDNTRIFCSGHSAGGHLTAMMLATDWSAVAPGLPSTPLAGALTLSGVFDIEPLTRAEFLRHDLGLDADGARALSPAFLELQSPVPLIRALGALESAEFHRQQEMLKAHWPSVCQTAMLDVPECNHLTVCEAFSTPGNMLFDAMKTAIQRSR